MDIDKELKLIYKKLHHKKIAVFAILGFLVLMTYLLIVVNGQVVDDQAMITSSEASTIVSSNGNGDGQSGGQFASGGDVAMSNLGKPIINLRRACYYGNDYYTFQLYEKRYSDESRYTCSYQCHDARGNLTLSRWTDFFSTTIPDDLSAQDYCQEISEEGCGCIAPTATPTPINITPTPTVPPVGQGGMCMSCTENPLSGDPDPRNHGLSRDQCMDAIHSLKLNCIWKNGMCQNGKLDPSLPNDPQIKVCMTTKAFCTADWIRKSKTNCKRYTMPPGLYGICAWDPKQGCIGL